MRPLVHKLVEVCKLLVAYHFVFVVASICCCFAHICLFPWCLVWFIVCCAVVQGKSSAVLLYGCSKTGKTYTVEVRNLAFVLLVGTIHHQLYFSATRKTPKLCGVCRAWVRLGATRRVWCLGLLLYCTIWFRPASIKAPSPSHRPVSTQIAETQKGSAVDKQPCCHSQTCQPIDMLLVASAS